MLKKYVYHPNISKSYEMTNMVAVAHWWEQRQEHKN